MENLLEKQVEENKIRVKLLAKNEELKEPENEAFLKALIRHEMEQIKPKLEKLEPSGMLKAIYEKIGDQLDDESKNNERLLAYKTAEEAWMCSTKFMLQTNYLLEDVADMSHFCMEGMGFKEYAAFRFDMRYGNGEIKNDTDEKREAYLNDNVIVSNLKKYGLDASKFWYALLFLADYIEGFDGGGYCFNVYAKFKYLVQLFDDEGYEIHSIEFGKVKKSSVRSAVDSNNFKVLKETIDSGTPLGRETIVQIGMALKEYLQQNHLIIPHHNAFNSGKKYHLTWTKRYALFVIYMQKFLQFKTFNDGRAPDGEWRFMSHLLAVLYPEQDEDKKLTAPGSHYLEGMATPKTKDSVRDIAFQVLSRHYPQEDLTLRLR